MVSNVVSQVAGGVKFGLTDAISQPVEAVTSVENVPVVHAQLSDCFEVMECASWPQIGDSTADGMVFES